MKANKPEAGREAGSQHTECKLPGGREHGLPVILLCPGRAAESVPRSRAVVIVTVLSAVPWLILPVVICLSQRLSHASLSISQIKAKPQKAH